MDKERKRSIGRVGGKEVGNGIWQIDFISYILGFLIKRVTDFRYVKVNLA
ncbi:hypothetical protein M0P98_01070 [bacterium]|nr:hypothetical protein [bacterium]